MHHTPRPLRPRSVSAGDMHASLCAVRGLDIILMLVMQIGQDDRRGKHVHQFQLFVLQKLLQPIELHSRAGGGGRRTGRTPTNASSDRRTCPLARTKRTKDRKASAKGADGTSDLYDAVFVVVDVDNITAKNLRSAQSTCGTNNMRLVISNPCVEVWLIDHVRVCPSRIVTADAAEKLAGSLGLTTGRDNKFLVKEKLRGLTKAATHNAAEHNRTDVAPRRASLQGKDFAPWTDFPDLVGSAMATKV